MTIEKTFHINASADAVWDIIAHRFHEAHVWASAVDHSEATEGESYACEVPLESGGRHCQTSLGDLYETMTHYDEEGKALGYDVKMPSAPFFVKKLANNWKVRETKAQSTSIDMRLEAELMPVFSTIMGPPMKRQFSSFLDEMAEELAHYVETGVPHPRKQAQLAQAA